MSIGDDLKEVVGPKYRHDISVAIVVVLAAWAAFSLNGRLEAAEQKADAAAALQVKIVNIEQRQAVMDQKVSDIDQNVGRLVSRILGADMVVHHPDPPPKKQ